MFLVYLVYLSLCLYLWSYLIFLELLYSENYCLLSFQNVEKVRKFQAFVFLFLPNFLSSLLYLFLLLHIQYFHKYLQLLVSYFLVLRLFLYFPLLLHYLQVLLFCLSFHMFLHSIYMFLFSLMFEILNFSFDTLHIPLRQYSNTPHRVLFHNLIYFHVFYIGMCNLSNFYCIFCIRQ